MSAPVLAIRVRALRRRPTVRVVWIYLATSLPLHDPQVIKVARTAGLLGIPRRRMRNALRLLVRHGYLRCETAPTMGTPGAYCFGPRAFAHGACHHDVMTLRNVQEQKNRVVEAAERVADDPSMLVTLFGAVRELRRITAAVGR